MQCVLALDVGTTSLKGALFDRTGRVVARHLEEYTLLKPAPDMVELEPETYWQAALKTIRAVIAQARIPAREILALGVTSQGETLIVLDRDGRPLRRAIVWLDNRSRAEAEAIGAAFGIDEIYRRTGQQEMVPTWTATRVEWLRRHEPQTHAAAHAFLLVEDYLLYRLTGRFITDRALNPSTLYYDLPAGDWWPEMLRFLGLRREQLPELKNSGEVAATLSARAARETGLDGDTRVTTAPIDQVAAAVGAGNLEPGVVTESTGAAMALCATLDRPLYDPQKRVGLYAHALPGRYVLLPWVPTAGMVLRWFRDEFGGGLDYPALIAEAEAVAPGADGLLMLPHLAGRVCPVADSRAKGLFLGLTLGHGRGHFVRAILESIAFMLRENLEMLESLGVGVREIRSLGGGARSDLWLRIKADVCRKEFLVLDCDEAASLGTAMIALVGAGLYPTLTAARDALVAVRRRVSADPESAARYDAAYARYGRVCRQMSGFF